MCGGVARRATLSTFNKTKNSGDTAVQGGYLDSCESLRTVWLWNEQYVTPDLVESLAGALPEARLYQGFDAAECAFFVTLLSLSHVDAEGALHGQPLPNIKVRPHRMQ